jgi:hypothetical protein
MTKAGLEPFGGVSLAIGYKRDRRLLVARDARCKHLGNEVATFIGTDVVALMGGRWSWPPRSRVAGGA